MSINYKKVAAGGLAGGVAMVIVNVVAQFVLTERVQREMSASIPALADHLSTGAGAIAAGIILKFVIGVMLVWLYAAMRPGFGPGLRTAACSAIFVWILGAIFFSDYLMMGIMSAATYALLEAFQLIAFLIAAWVGARIYS